MPSVVPYCRARGPMSASTRPAASAMSPTGNSSGAGKPPAKEMMSGRSVTFNISRIDDGFMADMRFAKTTPIYRLLNGLKPSKVIRYNQGTGGRSACFL